MKIRDGLSGRLILAAMLITAAVVTGGFYLARLRPSDYLVNQASDWQLRVFDLVLGYVVSLGLGGFAFGMIYLLLLHREVSERADAETSALELAQHDPLTGLPNRRKFHDQFPRLTADLPLDQFRAVLMLDVDGFKPINDVYGHAFGDLLLREFSERIEEVCGPEGFTARLGGDEFAIVSATLSDKAEAASLARRLLTRIQEPFLLENRSVQIGSGIGIAVYPEDGYSASELLRRADIALYRAKTSGRSAFRYFEMEMDASILHRTLLEQRLRAAMSAGDVHVHFQPILNLQTNTVSGFEALARWTDRDFGDVPPSQFVAIAEESGLISELTDQLLRDACRTATTWPEELYLSFNVSPLQLHDHSFPEKVLATLNDAGLAPARLMLEITETAIFKNPRVARSAVETLANSNVRIALDDFGTGHSSLGFLREFPISKVKIDKSFTMNMVDDPECAAIINGILTMTRGMGITTIAEGIEKAEILAQLNASGCQYGQGYFFGPARTAARVQAQFFSAHETSATSKPDAEELEPDEAATG